ncbi:unnamed protein product [Allacma fusca]|uniref:Uncharacterized protein n=1 Tax=Allacma fusca TaxID=39272 RepID=A0A8J2KHP6_9HEXA|nr:unnamed protein product [Allacma fusca]
MNFKSITDKDYWCASRSWALAVAIIQIITSVLFVILEIRALVTGGAAGSTTVFLIGWLLKAILAVVLLTGVRNSNLFWIQLWLGFIIVSIPINFVVNVTTLFLHSDKLGVTRIFWYWSSQ